MTFRMLGDRRLITVLVAAAAVSVAAVATVIPAGAASGAGPASPGPGRGPERYTIGLFGDMPYNALGRAQYPNLLADINPSHVAFSVFDGDLKAGGDGPCSDSLYTTALRELQHARAGRSSGCRATTTGPTAGAATARPQAPYSDPLERLNHRARSSSTRPTRASARRRSRSRASRARAASTRSTPRTCAGATGRSSTSASTSRARTTTIPYADADGETAPSRPQRREIERQRAEETARKAADLHWLSEGFAYAKQIARKGRHDRLAGRPELQQRAAPGRTRSTGTRSPTTSTRSHRDARVPRPGRAGARRLATTSRSTSRSTRPSGGVLANFTRVETFGARQHPLGKRHDRPEQPEPLRVRAAIVPANVG